MTLRRFGVWALLLATAVSAAPTMAEEPAAQFLEALRQRQYFEVADAYLEKMAQSPLAPADFRETIPFEQGKNLIAMSRLERDLDRRQQLLDQAHAKLKEFSTKHANHPLASDAAGDMANVLVERARVKMAEAEKPQNASRKPELMQQAATIFDQAEAEYKKQQNAIAEQLKKLPKLIPDTEKEKKALQTRLRGAYIEAQMLQAVTRKFKADTALDDKAKAKILKEAADMFGTMYDKYRVYHAGLNSRLLQGKCHQEIGGKENLELALNFYKDLLEQPDNDDHRARRTQALVQSIRCWIDESQNKHDEAIEKGMAWWQKKRPNEKRDQDWLELGYYTALAHAGKLKKINDKAPERPVLTRDAKTIIAFGMQNASGELKGKFQELNVEFGGKGPTQEKVDPKTFVDAYKAGQQSIISINDLNTQYAIVAKQHEETKDKAEKEKLQKQMDDTKDQMVSARFDAIKYLRMALRMVDDETEIEQINEARFFLCHMYYTEKNYHNAGVVGGFVAENSPGHHRALTCAQIALASAQQMFNASDEESNEAKAFEIANVVKAANRITDEWEGTAEAEQALLVLIDFMVRQKNIAGANHYLGKIPEDSEKRGKAEVKTGQAMWKAYLNGMRDVAKWNRGEEDPPQGVTAASREAELAPLKQSAATTLEQGVERIKKDGVSPSLMAAKMSLVQIYTNTQQAGKAIGMLEDPQTGVLTLVQKNDAAVQAKGYAEEAYSRALQAYIGALPGATNKAALMGKADKMMESLSKHVGEDAEGRKKLLSTYLRLAKDVEEQIALAPPADKPALNEGFALFLGRVADETNDFGRLRWVAFNFNSLGDNSWDGRGAPPAQAKEFYEKAEELYEKLVKMADKDKAISNDMETDTRVQLARVKRKLDKHLWAMDQYEIVLKKKTILPLQVEAAQTYQEWGRWGVPKLYRVAITGGRRDAKGKPTIWGYKQLDQVITQNMRKLQDEEAIAADTGQPLDADTLASNQKKISQYRDLLHEIKLHRAECFYKFAVHEKTDSDTEKEYLEAAVNWIRNTKLSYPTLGGPDWREEYDKLLKQIQTEQKRDPIGLAEFDQEETEDKTASAAN